MQKKVKMSLYQLSPFFLGFYTFKNFYLPLMFINLSLKFKKFYKLLKIK